MATIWGFYENRRVFGEFITSELRVAIEKALMVDNDIEIRRLAIDSLRNIYHYLPLEEQQKVLESVGIN